jgi:hypothetical protein
LIAKFKYFSKGINVQVTGLWKEELPEKRISQYPKNPTMFKIIGPDGQLDDYGEKEWYYIIIDTDTDCEVSLKMAFSKKAL